MEDGEAQSAYGGYAVSTGAAVDAVATGNRAFITGGLARFVGGYAGNFPAVAPSPRTTMSKPAEGWA